MNVPEVSIIIPAYNVEKYIGRTLEKVLYQTFQNFEVLIVNDGSTDRTEAIIRSYLSDPRFKLISQENHGVSYARNIGMELAVGKFICFLDGDDYWDHRFLELMYSKIKETGTDICYTGFYETRGKEIINDWKYEWVEAQILMDFLIRKTCLWIGAVMFNLWFLKQNKIKFALGCAVGEDQEFIIRALTLGKAVAVKANLVYKTIRPESASEWFNARHLDFYYALVRASHFVKENLGDRKDILDELEHHKIPLVLLSFLFKANSYGEREIVKKLLEDQDARNYLENFHHRSFKELLDFHLRFIGVRKPMLFLPIAKILGVLKRARLL